MEVTIKTIHFDASDKLKQFIEKKTAKLDRLAKEGEVELTLKVEKPESANNKTATMHMVAKGGNIHVEQTRNTFEDSIDACIELLQRQLVKLKEKEK